ncbi:MAG TPA: DNA replication/repair protein RecF [Ornithinibacter sp.]|nr:DNA replication/repair protein RecF [Ornithinibacter sp.]
MHVAALSLRDFRSYAELDLPLEPGVTTLVGHNGQGKTNLVEGLAYLATLGSHRVAADAPLVRQGAERAVVAAQVVRDDRTTVVEVEISPGRANRARVNRSATARSRDVLGILRVVLFAPEDLALVRGDPGERRTFLDQLATATAPRLAGTRADLERVLRQRTALLRSAASVRRGGSRSHVAPPEGMLELLAVWDDQLVEHAAELLAARARILQRLAPEVSDAYADLATGAAPHRSKARWTYRSSVLTAVEDATDIATTPDAADAGWWPPLLRAALAAVRHDELDRGVCLAGPHRDDLELHIGTLPAKGYASQGESWSLALALRLGAARLLDDPDDGGSPVLLLDDVFAELDSRRRDRLADRVAHAEQVLVTAAVADDVPQRLRGRRLLVEAGTVRDD